jgi:protein phosphatase
MVEATLQFTVATRTAVGARDEQEDAYGAEVLPDSVLAVVCDGMGGLGHGAEASTLAVAELRRLCSEKSEEDSYPEFFLQAVNVLDQLVYRQKSATGDRLAGGTTLVAVVLTQDRLYWASVGDSRLYIMRGAELVQVTQDHNYFLTLNRLRDEGKIAPADYEVEAERGEALLSYLGMNGVKLIDINSEPFVLQPGDTLLLTTDGLYRALPFAEMAELLATGAAAEAAEALVSTALGKGHLRQDNITCTVIKTYRSDNP